MPVIRFVHAADLHLDTAFPGIAREAPPELVRKLHESTFVALDRLIELCEQERPDFLVISGDVHNQEDRSLRAQLALRDGCERLRRSAVPVFIAHGNHDPLSSRLRHIRWPDNVTIFGAEVSSVPVFRRAAPPETAEEAPGSPAAGRPEPLPDAGPAPLALVHGISHATPRENRNLALRFRRGAVPCLQIGVLHCTPEGGSGKDRYAPCSPEDLAAAGLDYWALGHIHDRREICARPLAVYPGCAQGLHINEQGEKGCVVVTAAPDPAGGYALSTAFRPLGPVIWRIVDVPLDAAGAPAPLSGAGEDEASPAEGLSLDELEDRLRGALEAALDAQGPGCDALIVRLRLTGRTGLDAYLRREANRAELLERLRDWEPVTRRQGAAPVLWVKDLEILTRPAVDRRMLLEREDLLGEIFRLAEACKTTAGQREELRQGALSPLFDHQRARKILEPLTDEELLRLLDDAECLCLDLLENE